MTQAQALGRLGRFERNDRRRMNPVWPGYNWDWFVPFLPTENQSVDYIAFHSAGSTGTANGARRAVEAAGRWYFLQWVDSRVNHSLSRFNPGTSCFMNCSMFPSTAVDLPAFSECLVQRVFCGTGRTCEKVRFMMIHHCWRWRRQLRRCRWRWRKWWRRWRWCWCCWCWWSRSFLSSDIEHHAKRLMLL